MFQFCSAGAERDRNRAGQALRLAETWQNPGGEEFRRLAKRLNKSLTST
jgi:hypothetical protein